MFLGNASWRPMFEFFHVIVDRAGSWVGQTCVLVQKNFCLGLVSWVEWNVSEIGLWGLTDLCLGSDKLALGVDLLGQTKCLGHWSSGLVVVSLGVG